MKQLLTLVLAALCFVACTQNEVEELTANRADVPETLTVGFEGGDTRIELNEVLKTVWTEGDEVSVFYRSYENMRWAFQGETGDRSGELKRVSGEAGEQTMDNVVVVYPYNVAYMIDVTDGCVEASLPAVQSYKEGSYGAEGNIMVAESDYRQIILKSVVGWLRVELTGEGESVKSITLRGNAGEQVAGDILVNAADASCILASEGAAAEDNSEVAGNLMLEESILTEITLNCGSSVMLGSEAKSFYIALLPQTFEQGITIEVKCGNGTSTTKSTADKLVVERNHIVPMASFKYDGVLPEVYELAYTTNDGKPLDPYTTEGFGGKFVENIYDAATGRGVLKFAGAITTIPEQAFAICENLTWIDIPEGITTIGASAFTGCSALEEITIPASVTDVGNEAFKNCPCKATINCENVSFSGAGFTEVVIGDNVTTIGDSAFRDCSSLTSVTIPDSVKTIGYEAFRVCSNLTRVTIGNSVTTIGASAFFWCDSLTSVTIGNSVTTIGDRAFYWCSSLTSVTIPDSVTTIGNEAFFLCGSLTSVYCKATTPPAGGSKMFDETSATIYIPEGSLRAYKMAEYWSEYADCFVESDFMNGGELEITLSNITATSVDIKAVPDETISTFYLFVLNAEYFHRQYEIAGEGAYMAAMKSGHAWSSSTTLERTWGDLEPTTVYALLKLIVDRSGAEAFSWEEFTTAAPSGPAPELDAELRAAAKDAYKTLELFIKTNGTAVKYAFATTADVDIERQYATDSEIIASRGIVLEGDDLAAATSNGVTLPMEDLWPDTEYTAIVRALSSEKGETVTTLSFTTPAQPLPTRVESELFTSLIGEWEVSYSYRDTVGESLVIEGAKVRIAAGVDDYTNKHYRDLNRLVILDWPFQEHWASYDYTTNEPKHLAANNDYWKNNPNLAYRDYGPKIFLEIGEGDVISVPTSKNTYFYNERPNGGDLLHFYGTDLSSEQNAPCAFPVTLSADGNTLTIGACHSGAEYFYGVYRPAIWRDQEMRNVATTDIVLRRIK